MSSENCLELKFADEAVTNAIAHELMRRGAVYHRDFETLYGDRWRIVGLRVVSLDWYMPAVELAVAEVAP